MRTPVDSDRESLQCFHISRLLMLPGSGSNAMDGCKYILGSRRMEKLCNPIVVSASHVDRIQYICT